MKMATFNDPVVRFYYWGHARDNLWLTCLHDDQHAASSPDKSAIVNAGDIAKNAAHNDPIPKTGVAEFWGCNTATFAEAWSRAFETKAMGVKERWISQRYLKRAEYHR